MQNTVAEESDKKPSAKTNNPMNKNIPRPSHEIITPEPEINNNTTEDNYRVSLSRHRLGHEAARSQ